MISSFASLSIGDDTQLQSKQSHYDPFGPIGSAFNNSSAASAWKRFPDRYSPSSSSSSTWSSSSQSLSPGKTPSLAADSGFSTGSYFDEISKSPAATSVWNTEDVVGPVPVRLITPPTEHILPSPFYSTATNSSIPPPEHRPCTLQQHRFNSYPTERSNQSSCLSCRQGNQNLGQQVCGSYASTPLHPSRSFAPPCACRSPCSGHRHDVRGIGNNDNSNKINHHYHHHLSSPQSNVSTDMVYAHLKDLPVANRNLQRSEDLAAPTPLQLANYHSVNFQKNNNNDSYCSSNNSEKGHREPSPSSQSKAPINSTLYKTEICTSFLVEGHCPYGDKCKFAHGQSELRQVARHPKWRTRICSTFVAKGQCPYGFRCCFMHVLPSDPSYRYLTK